MHTGDWGEIICAINVSVAQPKLPVVWANNFANCFVGALGASKMRFGLFSESVFQPLLTLAQRNQKIVTGHRRTYSLMMQKCIGLLSTCLSIAVSSFICTQRGGQQPTQENTHSEDVLQWSRTHWGRANHVNWFANKTGVCIEKRTRGTEKNPDGCLVHECFALFRIVEKKESNAALILVSMCMWGTQDVPNLNARNRPYAFGPQGPPQFVKFATLRLKERCGWNSKALYIPGKPGNWGDCRGCFDSMSVAWAFHTSKKEFLPKSRKHEGPKK